MNKITQRFFSISLPALVVAGVLYGGFFLFYHFMDDNHEMCEKVSTLVNSQEGSEVCSWTSIASVNIFGYLGLFVLPILVCMVLLVFASNSRVASLEQQIKELKERLDV